MKIPRGMHPTGPDAANDVDIPAPRVPWVAADPLGIDGAERLYAHLTARARAAGYAELDRLSSVGGIVEPQPIRRRYGRSLLGLIGIVVLVLGGAAVIYG